MSQTIEITGGPSREDLFDSLRLAKPTMIHFKTKFTEWKAWVHITSIKHIQRRVEWEIGFLTTISEEIHLGMAGGNKPKIHDVLCRYSSNTRTGELVIEFFSME